LKYVTVESTAVSASLYPSLSLFIIYKKADHYFQHSFPTRRSSDLITGWGAPRVTADLLELAPDLQLVAHAAGTVKALFDPACYEDRKSTRLNSSHVSISYAVFCMKKKKNNLTSK